MVCQIHLIFFWGASIAPMYQRFFQDRISKLPEELKLHILGLLPRKSAIRTGVLSTEWKGLWKRRFNSQRLLEFSCEDESEEARQAYALLKHEEMQQAVYKRAQSMRLYFCVPKDFEKIVLSWIPKAIESGVEQASIDFSQGIMLPHIDNTVDFRGRRPELKEFLFKDNSIVNMSLRYCRLSGRFRFLCFKGLETMRLHAVNITALLFDRMLVSCMSLKTLVVSKCGALDEVDIDDQNPELKYVGIFDCTSLTYVKIQAPNLLKFHIVGTPPRQLTIEDASSLVDLSLFFSTPIICNSLLNWRIDFASMKNLEALSLCSSLLQRLFSFQEPFMFIVLHNMRRLKLRLMPMVSGNIRLISRFFKCCYFPNLEEVTVEIVDNICPSNVSMGGSSICQMAIEDTVTRRAFYKLRKVELINFANDDSQLSLVDFLVERLGFVTNYCLTNHKHLYARHNPILVACYLQKRLSCNGGTGVIRCQVTEKPADLASEFP